jgi:hypothetical protein
MHSPPEQVLLSRRNIQGEPQFLAGRQLKLTASRGLLYNQVLVA